MNTRIAACDVVGSSWTSGSESFVRPVMPSFSRSRSLSEARACKMFWRMSDDLSDRQEESELGVDVDADAAVRLEAAEGADRLARAGAAVGQRDRVVVGPVQRGAERRRREDLVGARTIRED